MNQSNEQEIFEGRKIKDYYFPTVFLINLCLREVFKKKGTLYILKYEQIYRDKGQ